MKKPMPIIPYYIIDNCFKKHISKKLKKHRKKIITLKVN